MDEINHSWTMWTSLLYQVPHGVINPQQAKIVMSSAVRIHKRIMAEITFLPPHTGALGVSLILNNFKDIIW